jgi:hypothetical protein
MFLSFNSWTTQQLHDPNDHLLNFTQFCHCSLSHSTTSVYWVTVAPCFSFVATCQATRQLQRGFHVAWSQNSLPPKTEAKLITEALRNPREASCILQAEPTRSWHLLRTSLHQDQQSAVGHEANSNTSPNFGGFFWGKPEKTPAIPWFLPEQKKAFSTQLILMLMNVGCKVQISSTFRNPKYREYEMVLVATSSISWTWPTMAHLSPLFSSAVLAAPHVPLPEAARPVGSRNRPGTLGTTAPKSAVCCSHRLRKGRTQ